MPRLLTWKLLNIITEEIVLQVSKKLLYHFQYCKNLMEAFLLMKLICIQIKVMSQIGYLWRTTLNLCHMAIEFKA